MNLTLRNMAFTLKVFQPIGANIHKELIESNLLAEESGVNDNHKKY